MMNLHPFWSGHVANLLAGQLQAGLFADAEHFSNRVDRLNAGRVSELIEKRIARNLDRIAQTDCAVGVMLFVYPALKEVVAVTHAAAATVLRARKIFSQTGERRDEFECRSWRKRTDCAIKQRIAFTFAQRLTVFRF